MSAPKKFETDILIAFEAKHNAINSYANDLLLSKMVFNGLSLFEVCTFTYNTFVFNAARKTYTYSVLGATVSKLNEIILTERKLKTTSQKMNIQNAVYPLIFLLISKAYKTPTFEIVD